MKNSRKIVIICLSLLFILLTILVKLDMLEKIDTFVYNLITFNITDGWTTFYKIITFLGSTTFIVSLCAFFLVLFLILKRKNHGLIVTVTLVISTLINNALKLIIRRERPLVEHFVEEHSFSFPSGHTMAAVSMYGMLLYFVLKSNINKYLKIVLSIVLAGLPVMVGISRIYLGAHFMSDVVGSFLVSIVIILVITHYIDKKKLL